MSANLDILLFIGEQILPEAVLSVAIWLLFRRLQAPGLFWIYFVLVLLSLAPKLIVEALLMVGDLKLETFHLVSTNIGWRLHAFVGPVTLLVLANRIKSGAVRHAAE